MSSNDFHIHAPTTEMSLRTHGCRDVEDFDSLYLYCLHWYSIASFSPNVQNRTERRLDTSIINLKRFDEMQSKN
jgi:Mg2+ and Co2+ transporter CorA